MPCPQRRPHDEKPAETSTDAATLSDVKPVEVAGPAEEASFGGLFEKSADADFSMDETPAEKPVEVAPEESKPSESDVPATHMAFTEEESPSKLDDNLQVKNCPGLYIIGEAVNVNGICGGYNLQWAWTSAALAAEGISQNV